MQNDYNYNQNYQFQQTLPNSSTVLVLGILSIVLFCCCYGIIGLLLGILAIYLGNKATFLYQLSPDNYTISSLNNLNAGKICAYIGLVISSIYILVAIFLIAFYGFLFSQLLLPINN